MALRPIHAQWATKCVDGQYRGFHTLCGLEVHNPELGAIPDPESVTCKTCLRSPRWDTMLKSLEEAHGA